MKSLTPSRVTVYAECQINGYVHLFTLEAYKEIEEVCLDYYQRIGAKPLHQDVECFAHFAKQGVKVRLK